MYSYDQAYDKAVEVSEQDGYAVMASKGDGSYTLCSQIPEESPELYSEDLETEHEFYNGECYE